MIYRIYLAISRAIFPLLLMTLSKIFAREGGSAYSQELSRESFFKDSKTNKSVTKKHLLDHCLLCMWWLLKELFCVVLLQRSFYYSLSSSSSLLVSNSSSISSSLLALAFCLCTQHRLQSRLVRWRCRRTGRIS